MRILWLCNVVLPELADEFNIKKVNVGGWLTGMWEELKKDDELELAICVPIRNPAIMKNGQFDRYLYYSFLTISNESNTDINDQVDRFKDIICLFKPDVIHVWGTEFYHTYSMLKACEEMQINKRVIINIQGILEYYKRVYDIGVPVELFDSDSLDNSLIKELNAFKNRSEYEKKALLLASVCVGRTDWDKSCVLHVNSKIKYYKCGEILRNKFYTSKKWNPNECVRHTIFISQIGYPIKGFHIIINELKSLKNKYQDMKVRVAGVDIRFTNNTYHKYLIDEIKNEGLEDVVEFLGELDEEQMIKEYRRANVSLSSSLIENSSNSICESMMIGTPIVASFVGGTPSLISHGEDGFLYPLNEPYMMSYYIGILFETEKLCLTISKNEIKKAKILNNKNEIKKKMKNIYWHVVENACE